ncbi:BACON domain-containing protein [uncultured Rikenella sp.]|uniref:BACON domain-containing protein n=1 Tax=uncultured Rikenella sp. TaxID=368003 RepID=UPI0025E4E3EB|nr:BACON domain-containing protein [uncultured Rikenella sp.]
MIGTGNKKSKLFLGKTSVRKAYLGAVKVYPNSFLELSATSFSFAAAGSTAELKIEVNDGQAWSLNELPSGWSVSAASGTGPASISITAPNNRSTNTVTATLSVTSEDDLSAIVSVSQAAGVKIYGAWQNVGLTIDTTSFPASGGSCAMRVQVQRIWTWNGVAGSGGTDASTASLVHATTSDSIATVSGNTLTVGSLDTIAKSATVITISAETEYDTTKVSANITQAENKATYGDTHIVYNGSSTGTNFGSQFSYNMNSTSLSLSQRQKVDYSSGATKTVTTSAKPSYKSSANWVTVSDITDYNGYSTAQTYSFLFSFGENSTASSRSAIITFTFPNGDVFTMTLRQDAIPKTFQYLKLVPLNTSSEMHIGSLTVEWGTANGNYSNSQTFTGDALLADRTLTLGQYLSGQTIYFRFTGTTGGMKTKMTFSSGSKLSFTSGRYVYTGADTIELYATMTAGTSDTAVLQWTFSSGGLIDL